MKRNRITAYLLCAALSLPLGGNLPAYAETEDENSLHIGHFDSYEQYRAYSLGETVKAPLVSDGVTAAVSAALPSAYDMRREGVATIAKEQGSFGTCWTFAAMHSLETALSAEEPEIDLSEWHLAYYAYSDLFGFVAEEHTDKFNNGGNLLMISAMLAGWIGPAAESDFPYQDRTVLDPDRTREELQSDAVYHVTDAIELPYDVYEDESTLAAQRTAIKNAVYSGHAVSMSYFDSDTFYHDGCHSYYFPFDPENSVYSGEYHAVSVIGWDDEYPAENFSNPAGADGAFLVKNSWGADWGDGGCFWLSYEDMSIYESYYLKASPAQTHSKNYQYDDYGCGVALSVETEDTSAWMANVFTAEEDTYITDVMVFNAMPDENYTITVYTGLTDDAQPSSGTPSGVTSGKLTQIGYQTIKLSAPVKVHAGEKFSVAVNFNGSAGQHITCEAAYRSTSTYPDETVEVYDGYLTSPEMLNRTFAENQSFYSADGMEWFDLYDESISDTYTYEDENGDEIIVESFTMLGNACIKALTQEEGLVLFSDYHETLPVGAEIVLSTPGGEDIYYSIDGGKTYSRYTEPIVFAEEMTVSAYAEGFGTVYEQHYDVRHAGLSYLYCGEYDADEPLAFTKTAEGRYEATYWYDAELPQSMHLYPVTTGTAVCSGNILSSGETAEVSIAEESLVLTVSNENCLDTEYIIRIRKTGSYLLGDADNDGQVTALDAADVLVYAAAVGASGTLELPDSAWTLRADHNEDTLIDAADAASILVQAAAEGAE